MTQIPPHRGLPAGNPLANLLVIIVGVLAIAVSLVLGFFAFVIIGSIAAVLAAIIGIRVWWFRRKMGGRTPTGPSAKSQTPAGGVIEGEYRVVADEREGE